MKSGGIDSEQSPVNSLLMAGMPLGDARAPYQGEDRRRIAGPVQSPFGRPYVMAILLLLLTWGALTFVLKLSGTWVVGAQELMQMLQVASFVVAVAVAGLAFSRWYLTSDAPALWIGVALMVYGVGRLFVSELLPLVLPDTQIASLTAWVRPATQIVVAALLLRAVTILPVSTRVSGPRLIGVTVLAVSGLTLMFSLLPTLANLVDGARPTAPRGYRVVNELGIMSAAWLTVAAGFTWRGLRRHRWLFTWLGLMLLCLSLGDLTRVLAPPPVEAGLLGKEVMRLLGLVLALNGATREILYTYRDSSTRLAKSEYTAMTAEERIREGQAAAEERAHEARSALAAIEGATRTLEHYRDRLPEETQTALSTAISGEIRRLQRLVSVEESNGEAVEFSLAESLAPIVASERARGVMVDVRVPGDLNVVGRLGATEQVIQTLFDNARRYAAGTRMTVRADREDSWVVLRVEDRGPGVPADQREAIFQRGVRGDNAVQVPGSGLGLYVAAKLMREQDCELWVDERPGGGASFAIALPAADASAGTEETVQRLQQASEIDDGSGLSATHRGD